MRSVTVLRAAATLVVVGGGGWCAVDLAGPAAQGLLGGPRTFEQAVTGSCGVLLLGCAAWLALVVTTGVLGALLRLLPQRGVVEHVARALDRCTPTVVRGVVATALGLSVAAGAAGPALADVTGPAPVHDLAGLALPDRTVGGGPVPSASPRASSASGRVVVRPGDSLWAIAARRLPSTASDAETARAVDRLYAANRTAVGPDPDLIVPGTSLLLPVLPVLPDLDAHHRKDRP
jgi:hypothetical protein